jgi:hypothetical protein
VTKLSGLFVTLLVVGLAAPAVADAPVYAPYGAWRGRIRYVEGPWRTRSFIRWGAGITPTGGQVLMHGFDAAQAVLTSPDFWSQVIGTKDAELASRESELTGQVAAIQLTNAALRSDLDQLLHALEITPEPVVSPVATPQPSFSVRFDEFVTLFVSLNKQGRALLESAKTLAQIGKVIYDNHAALKLSGDQLRTLEELNAFLKKVLGDAAYDNLPPLPADCQDLATVRAKYRGLLKEWLEITYPQAVELSQKTVDAGDKLRNEIKDDYLERTAEKAREIQVKIKGWGPAPSLKNDPFAVQSAEPPQSTP